MSSSDASASVPTESRMSSSGQGHADSKRWGSSPIDPLLLQPPTRLPRRLRPEWRTVAAWSLALLLQIVLRLDEDFSYGSDRAWRMAEAYSNATILLCVLGLVSCLVLLGTEALRAAIWGTALATITLIASLVSWMVLYGLRPVDYVWWTRGWVINAAFGIVLSRTIRDLVNNINDSIGHRYKV